MKLMKAILNLLGIRYQEEHYGERWSEDDEFCLRSMTIAGKEDKKIATTLGRTKRAIQQKRYEMNKIK